MHDALPERDADACSWWLAPSVPRLLGSGVCPIWTEHAAGRRQGRAGYLMSAAQFDEHMTKLLSVDALSPIPQTVGPVRRAHLLNGYDTITFYQD